MSKVRVYEVARQLGINNRDLVAAFQSLGFHDVRNHMSAVEAEAVERVRRRLEKQQATDDVVEERIAHGVVKRRSRAVVPAAVPSSLGEASAPEPAASRVPAAPPAPPSLPRVEPPPAAEPAPAFEAPPPLVDERPRVSAPAAASAPGEVAAFEPPPPDVGMTTEPAFSPVPPPVASAPALEPVPTPAPELPAVTPSAPAAVFDVPEVSDAASVEEPSAPGRSKAIEPTVQSPTVMRRPSVPPKSGIEVWEGRPGVPMPQRPRVAAGTPGMRRTTYDPRAATANRRPGYPYGTRMLPGRPGGGRPGFRRGPGGAPIPMRGVPGRPGMVSTKEMSAHKMVIKIEGETSLQSLAGKMSVKATDVLMRLLSMGLGGVNINSTLDADTAKLLASEFGWNVEDISVDEEHSLEAAMEGDVEADGELQVRSPIVTVMGHVDHGKTTLLDYIRKAQVAAGEAGGITQHIGAYRVETSKGTIAFLDTPGHEAFTAMRMRGATVTDIVILVVAADDGVMPQTREAINHAKSAGVPIIVAVNKMDLPGVDPERVMRELSTEGLTPEEWGGETICVRVSARTGAGVDALLDAVMLQAEMLELVANPNKRASGVVVEALLDRGRGPVARVLVQDGTLRRGDVLLAGAAVGKIRAMVDEMGRQLAEAGPSTPVEVLGLNEVPSAGDPAHAVKDVRAAEAIAAERKKRTQKSATPQDTRVSLEALTSRLQQDGTPLELNVIIKADVQGSAEALTHALGKLSTAKVKLNVVHAGVGGITESDVNLAGASKAIILGFSVRPAGKAKKVAEEEGVEIRLYDIIYEAIDEVRKAMEGLLPATKVEKEIGKAEVREVFHITKIGTVAGCLVVEGMVKRSAQARLIRDSVVVWSGRIGGLRRFKDDARDVKEGFECGIALENYADIKQGDIIECIEVEEVKATL